MFEYDGPKRELESELARELQSACADAPAEFDRAVAHVGLDPQEFISAIDECFPENHLTNFVDEKTAELIRVYLGNGILIGIQFQQNRIFKAMDDESEATT